MRNSNEDAAGVLVLLGVLLLLCIAVLMLGIVFVILVALLFLCWILTYWLLRLINEVLTDNWVTESEGLLALVLPFFLYAGLTWWFFPREWVGAIAVYLGWSMVKTWLSLLVGAGLLGMSFGFLSLPMLESQEGKDKPKLNANGMLMLPSGKGDDDEDTENWEFLTEGVLLGEDI
jgi:hypothetical protein